MPRKYIWVLVVLLVATTLAAVYEYYNEQYRSECSPLQSCREQKTYTKVTMLIMAKSSAMPEIFGIDQVVIGLRK
nr:hypothetical protein [Pyrobaculum sp.]